MPGVSNDLTGANGDISALAEVNLDAIPDGIKVKTKSIRAKTGERVNVTQDAKEALHDIDKSIDTWKKLLACLGAD